MPLASLALWACGETPTSSADAGVVSEASCPRGFGYSAAAGCEASVTCMPERSVIKPALGCSCATGSPVSYGCATSREPITGKIDCLDAGGD